MWTFGYDHQSSSRSDLTLYSSDNDTTMHKIAAKCTSGFIETCVNMLQRMIETVPKGVVLRDSIKPQMIKPINTTLDIDILETVGFIGVIRVSSLQSARFR